MRKRGQETQSPVESAVRVLHVRLAAAGGFRQPLQDGHVSSVERSGLGGKDFDDSKDLAACAHRNRNHGADAESPAALLIDASVGLGVIAKQAFSRANALA